MDIVQLFIQAGADVNMRHQTGRYGSPFIAAAFFVDDLDIIHYLVDKCGADIHALHLTGDYGSALVAAVNGLDADCEFRTGAYGSALVVAAAAAAAKRWRRQDPAVVKYLLNLGVDTNRELQIGDHGSALVATAASGNLEQMKYLVEDGNANVDLVLRSGSFRNALIAAAAKSNLREVEYLVEKGRANVDLLLGSGYFGSALIAAITSTFEFPVDQDIIENLWRSSLDIDLATQILDDDLTRVVLSASFAPHYKLKKAFRVVKCLVDAGANVNLELKVGTFGNALTAAVAIGNLDQVKYLMREGSANANLQLNTGSFGSALVVAIIAYSKIRKLHPDAIHPTAIETLKEIVVGHTVDFIQPGRPPKNMAATVARSLIDSTKISLIDIIVYLLESGADANLQLNVGPFRSALVAAAATGCFWHVKYLVENAQADVSLQLRSGPYANAYEAAVAHEHHDIAEYLARNAGGDYAVSFPSSLSISANPHDEGQQERE
ncbi:hypothetical protein N7541_006473 [Penicillium brevicompactum]|uniref:Ankyrin n=1 Tax=Penicillium brevicompactum TaxID=5074 RepID=A0A9W9R763_PENBR|nr:hypothetical protein N7541_006473 [Penicillium brevicompactum]